MKVKKIVDNTTNRGEFNRAYKQYLERTGNIRCSYCRYHTNDNGKNRGYYGGFSEKRTRHETIRYPNWKLVSRNRKQWGDKQLVFTTTKQRFGYRDYIDITW